MKKEIDESNAERLRPYTDYTAKVIALVKNELGEMSLKGSEEVSFTTKEGGKINVVCSKNFGVHGTLERNGGNGVRRMYIIHFQKEGSEPHTHLATHLSSVSALILLKLLCSVFVVLHCVNLSCF